MKTVRRSKTRQILNATVKQMHRAVSAGANTAKEVAEIYVPRDKGDLASTLEVKDDGNGHAEFSVGGESKISDKTVDYVFPVEFGSTHKTPSGETYSIPAQPFFRPGLDAGRKKMKEEMRIVEK